MRDAQIFLPLYDGLWHFICVLASTLTIVAISCLLCMDFDCSQGVSLHPAPSSHTNTQITYILAQKG